MDAKPCYKCHCVKPIDQFYPHKQMRDGRLNQCKECSKKSATEHRLANLEKVRQYDRMRASMPHRMAAAKKIQERWNKAHPDRRAANVKLGNAVRDGRVKPWPVCAIHDCSSKPEGHHPDYGTPLQVVWLCAAHHKQAHAMTRKLLEAAECAV